MKTSKIVARSMLRLFFILLCVGLASYFFHFGAFKNYDANQHEQYFILHRSWALVYPALLVICFVALLIISLRNKFEKQDVNWLLVLNTAILMMYSLVLYLKIYQILMGHPMV